MKPEHEELIEAMAEAMSCNGAEGDDDEVKSDAMAALIAAQERGYVLAKLPPEAGPGNVDDYSQGLESGWNNCLDAIETVRIEE